MVNVIFKGFCYLSLPILGVLACVYYISCKFGGMNSLFLHIHISILTYLSIYSSRFPPLFGLGVLHLGHVLLQLQTFAPQVGQVQLILIYTYLLYVHSVLRVVLVLLHTTKVLPHLRLFVCLIHPFQSL